MTFVSQAESSRHFIPAVRRYHPESTTFWGPAHTRFEFNYRGAFDGVVGAFSENDAGKLSDDFELG